MPIERLRERFELIIMNFDPDVNLLPLGKTQHERGLMCITQVADIHAAMKLDALMGSNAGTIHNFNLVLAGKYKSAEVPRRYTQYISRLYPQVPEAVLLKPDFETFEKFMRPVIDAKKRWTNAAGHLSAMRGRMNHLMKDFYSGVDETQKPGFAYSNFPLVAKASWILEKPLLLEPQENSAYLSPLEAAASTSPPPTLEGLNLTAIQFRSMVQRQTRLRKWGYPFFNGATYVIVGNPANDINKMTYVLSDYFSYVNTCEYLALELADAHSRFGDKITKNDLPVRSTPDKIFDFTSRSCFPGVNCLTIGLNYSSTKDNRKRNVYWIHKRDSALMEAQNCVHVVPAGGHQPLNNSPDNNEESQIYRTVIREFVEELFNKEDLIVHKNGSPNWTDKPDIKSLHDAFFKSHTYEQPPARVYLLGMGFDPVTTKPEILVVIIVDWAAAKRNGLNKEIYWNPEAIGEEVPLSATALAREAMGNLRPIGGERRPILPAGAACMMIAAKHFTALTGLPAQPLPRSST